MSNFNGLIPNGFVVVATEDKYSDNNGAYSIAYCWDGKDITTVNYANGYNNVSHDTVNVNATKEQIKQASDFYINNALSMEESRPTITGCTVILARSRKAPNKVELKVVAFSEGGYNSVYNNYEDPRVLVEVEDQKVWVNRSCIKAIVKGNAPWWC